MLTQAFMFTRKLGLKSMFARWLRRSAHQNFHHIMEMAYQINEVDPAGLSEFIRALLRPVQAEHLLAVAEREQHAAPPALEAGRFFFDFWKLEDVQPLRIQPTPRVKISLSRDTVLPTPWNRRRYISALATIGQGKSQQEWRQDSNHQVSVWLPWRIAFVTGGNHSITAGILAGEGSLVATEVMDASAVCAAVACDGRTYKHIETGRTLAVVHDARRAAVYEIGRLLCAGAGVQPAV